MANFYLLGSGKNKNKGKRISTKELRQKNHQQLSNNVIISIHPNARKRIYTYTRKYKIITNFNSKPLFKPSKTLLPTKWTLVPSQQKYRLKSKISNKHTKII